ncbi:radical SAM protein [Candidatus Endomicrobiellum devescovinae]|jgi:putative pyruvate formate lyase activating enzyme|uniref:radical SAM protein n=1 Tax=Candidatus Endomicrobiellum devescovinae TaxID=3242322 RepID=UPI00282BAAFC|nr:radical SAM protein [Endomicrobium sp.]MDR1434343.1 radical SAM protein [Endomicrobium sp.]
MIDFEGNIEKLYSVMDKCELCPRNCKVNRNKGQKGFCCAAEKILVASCNVHTGEEPPISGSRGSGTIFFSNCTLNCIFCQNYPISQLGNGREISHDDLVDTMLNLQKRGVHNINFVTPTHYSAHIAKAVYLSRKKGLTIPIVYNCSGYESVEILKLLEGIIDIYLPDIKYSSDELAFKYSGIKNYVEINRAALKEMKRQVGDLSVDKNGIAKRGIIIRHLVLPGSIENTKKALDFIAQELSNNTFVSLMAQYHSANKSYEFKELSRCLTEKEYEEAVKYLEKIGLENGWIQDLNNEE